MITLLIIHRLIPRFDDRGRIEEIICLIDLKQLILETNMWRNLKRSSFPENGPN
ncbi:uncharacterized protein [Blastocystis hominis]|uniref:Uncharacterized protein n=1 Tax=Blastocystis hominis TaxID=12968 RepID=D8M6D0_BLAHO|nr:uncharacterized protein [Blastocystis hominis]CBK23683.2 unnamed protein product [Blastocystis hominis]|eukprot:XP_012897731.1 uncharacterized protein [Blastocystis hominis]